MVRPVLGCYVTGNAQYANQFEFSGGLFASSLAFRGAVVGAKFAPAASFRTRVSFAEVLEMSQAIRLGLLAGLALASLLWGGAEAQAPAIPAAASPAPSPAPAAAPYSLPWLLRPAMPGSVVRLDETMAFLEDPASGSAGASYLTSLIVTHKLSARWVPIFRETFVSNDAPTAATDGRFLVLLLDPRAIPTQVNVVLNWFEELKAKVPSR